MTASWSQPFRGIRILDFSMVLAGPYCGAMLGALGAEVIKVESSIQMDSTRMRSHSYHQYNHNKRSISLNLQSTGAPEIAKRLVSQCDVVLEAFRPGVLKRLGLDYESLRAVKPNLLMTSISGSGQTGPDAQFGGYAAIFAAQGGMTYLTGYSDGIPTEWRGSVDLRLGTAAFAATVAGLRRLGLTGQGGHIDIAGREMVSVLCGDAIVAAQSTSELPGPVGNDDGIVAPNGVFQSVDPTAWVSVAVATDAEWRSLCDVAGLYSLRDDERYADAFRRWKHRDELNDLVRGWMATQPALSTVRRLQARGVGAALTMRVDQIHRDRHLIDRGFWQPYTIPPTPGDALRRPKQVRVIGAPWSFDGTRDFYSVEQAPDFAADNEYVYMDVLGLSRTRYEELLQTGVIS